MAIFYRRYCADVLGETVVAAIERFDASCNQGEPDMDALSEALVGVGSLSPSRVATIASALSFATRFHEGSPPQRWWGLLETPARSIAVDEVPGTELLLMCNWNGFRRQAALEGLSQPLPTPLFCVLLEWRSNDWVAQVRSAAQAAAERCFSQTRPDILALALFSLAQSRTSWRRSSFADSPLLNTLQRLEVAEEFAHLLAASSAGPGTRLLGQALRFATIDPHLAMLSREAIQPGVRAVATKARIGGSARWIVGMKRQWVDKTMGQWNVVPEYASRALAKPEIRSRVIEEALADRSTAVQSVGLQGLIDHLPQTPFAQEKAQEFRNSPRGKLASRADFLIRKNAIS